MIPLSQRPTADECSRYYFTYVQLVPDGDILRTLHTQHADIHSLLKDSSDTSATASPAPGEWSIKQVIAHLSDTERLFAFRALWFARGEQSALPGWNQIRGLRSAMPIDGRYTICLPN
ncbi:MAG: DinB family protein [Chloroflexi bacterium]|uniref:DinB family protein n=1 Tax=Candidatus Flexifilum breve TaxID=3140694 RepID=UPI0031362260|nr:DinB family protein [Chloroflexota bacterium]